MSDPLAPPQEDEGPHRMLLIGHRGAGTCEEQELLRKRCEESGTLLVPERIRENTLRSMLATHAAGGHFVEFDVQLSRDRVPVIHHNFYTDDGRFVGDLTLAELQALNVGSGYRPDEHQYSTLESFFALLPEELGFDVEIKFPRYFLDGRSLCPEFQWTVEDYVAPIVEVVKSFTSGSQARRPLFYSCFVSSVCLMLRQLHPDCPVVYLVNHKEAHKYTEVTGAGANAAIEFAASARLHGVAVHSEELLLPPRRPLADGLVDDEARPEREEAGREFALQCQRRRLYSLTWGPANNAAENRRLQRAWGIVGVIFDNIHSREDL